MNACKSAPTHGQNIPGRVARTTGFGVLLAALLMTVACSQNDGEGKNDARAANMVLVEKLLTAYNTGDLAILDEIVDASFTNHIPAGPTGTSGPRGPQAFHGIITTLRGAMPDLKMVPQAIVAEDDRGRAFAVRHPAHGAARWPARPAVYRF